MGQQDIDYRLIGRLSISYMIAIVSEILRTRPVDFMDLLIVSAIFNANGETRRGVSRNAISRTLNVPLETVRRRVIGLLERKALVEQQDGLVFAYDNDISLGNSPVLDDLNLRQLRQLFQALKANGIEFE